MAYNSMVRGAHSELAVDPDPAREEVAKKKVSQLPCIIYSTNVTNRHPSAHHDTSKLSHNAIKVFSSQ